MDESRLDGIARRYDWTETGTAKRIVDLYHDEIRCCKDTGAMYLYNKDSCLWEEANIGAVLKKIEEIADIVSGDGSDITGNKYFYHYVLTLGSVSHLKNALLVAKASLACEQKDFDASQNLLGLPGGKVLDVLTGEIKDGASEYMLTKSLCGVPKSVISDDFRKYITVFMSVKEERDYLQMYLGSALLGYMLRNGSDKKVLFIDNAGNTGKTTFLKLLKKSMGGYYKDTVIGILIEKVTDANKPNALLGELGRGCRVAGASECPADAVFSTDTFKKLSGNDTVVARFPYDKRPFYYDPDFRLLVMSNILPYPDNGDDIAFRARFRRIRRDKPLDQVDEDMMQKVGKQEFLDDMITWLLEGCRMYLERKGRLDDYNGSNLDECNLPESMKKAIKTYIGETDDMLDFLTANYKRDSTEENFISWQDMYVEWKKYTDDSKTGYIKFCREARNAMKKYGFKEKRKFVTVNDKKQYLLGVVGLRRIIANDVRQQKPKPKITVVDKQR